MRGLEVANLPPIYFDKAKVDAEAKILRNQGYTDDEIVIVQRGNVMCAEPKCGAFIGKVG